MDELRSQARNTVEPEGLGLLGLRTEPNFAIAQRALHVPAGGGAVLWDCITLVDQPSTAAIEQAGPVQAIAISHPHYYSGMIEWSRALGGVPVYLHADDRQWVMRPDPAIVFWQGEHTEIAPGLTLHRCGGHFAGGTILHWAGGADGRGALLVGDILQVGQDRRSVSVMYSYPNYIPVSAATIERIAQRLQPLAFDEVYGAWTGRNIIGDAKAAVERSLERYCRADEGGR
jgi:glyoxylase-like metal-dependent hydrolase (beta-lactamase superfamily II)